MTKKYRHYAACKDFFLNQLSNSRLHKYLNQYPAADEKIKKLAKDVAKAEETLVKELRPYL